MRYEQNYHPVILNFFIELNIALRYQIQSQNSIYVWNVIVQKARSELEKDIEPEICQYW